MEEVRTAVAQNPEILFSDARFFSSENTPQREVLIDLISKRGGDLSTQQVVSVTWMVMGKPGLLPTFAPLCERPELMDVQRKWCTTRKCLGTSGCGALSVRWNGVKKLSWIHFFTSRKIPR